MEIFRQGERGSSVRTERPRAEAPKPARRAEVSEDVMREWYKDLPEAQLQARVKELGEKMQSARDESELRGRISELHDPEVDRLRGEARRAQREQGVITKILRSRAEEQLPREMTREVAFEIAAKAAKDAKAPAHVEAPRDPHAVMNARVRPEGFWERLKRTWFSGRTETPAVSQPQPASVRPTTSVETQRALLSRGVVSARKEAQPERGFFGRFFDRLSGRTRGQERAAAYASNIEKVGKHPEYVLNPRLDKQDGIHEIAPEDLEEVPEVRKAS